MVSKADCVRSDGEHRVQDTVLDSRQPTSSSHSHTNRCVEFSGKSSDLLMFRTPSILLAVVWVSQQDLTPCIANIGLYRNNLIAFYLNEVFKRIGITSE